MDNLIRNVYAYDLSGIDVAKITRGKAVVRLYKDLLKFDNIVDALGDNGKMLLLFPVQSDREGHWISVFYNKEKNEITHFDSYGLSWEKELGYTDNEYAKRDLLGNLYRKAGENGIKVTYNRYRLQKMKDGRNDCGRWASIRLRFSYLNNEEFARLFLNQTMSADWLVTCLTFITLREDEKDEEKIIRELS